MAVIFAPELDSQSKRGTQGSPAKKGGIRPCRSEDFEQVASLFGEAFAKNRKLRKTGNLPEFFRSIYMHNPWASERFPSLVYDRDGEITGFLGVIARKMRFRRQPITAAISSMFMVKADEHGNRSPLTGALLMRRYLAGDQDLSLTDTANDITRSMWESCGGKIAHPYSYSWLRPLRPVETLLNLGIKSPLVRSLAGPATRLADIFARRLGPIKTTKPDCEVVDLDAGRLLELSGMVPECALMPEYDLESLRWLIEMAECSSTEGDLAKREVRSASGRPLGWYVYYRRRHGIGRVLQMVAFPGAMEVVLDSLLHEAEMEGVAALKGRTDPAHASLLTGRRCSFFGRPWFLVHSRDPELVRAFQAADIHFTGFDGEHWMKVNALQ